MRLIKVPYPDSGSEQSKLVRFPNITRTSSLTFIVDYMTGFRCDVTNAQSTVPIAKSQVPRRCGADPKNGVQNGSPGNCTYGAKQPLYWFQRERNNVCPLCTSSLYLYLVPAPFMPDV